MQSTHERGRFFIGPNGHPRFAGSSSGVYLADTVRTQLSNDQDEEETGQDLDSEIEQAFISRNTGRTFEESAQIYGQDLLKVSDLRSEPAMRAFITGYFGRWHPLFPFLDGAYLIQCFDAAVDLAAQEAGEPGYDSHHGSEFSSTGKMAFQGLSPEEGLILSATFISIFSLGGLDNASASDNLLPATHTYPRFRSASHATRLAHQIVEIIQTAKVNDLFALQSLLAIQLYLYASRSLRPAMHMSGSLIKLAYESGLHRCPGRYRRTFTYPAVRQLRKRVFYSLYSLDRLLSAEFGTPIMMHDTDIDTCLPGDIERHVDETIPSRSKASEAIVTSPGTGQKRQRVEDVTVSLLDSGSSPKEVMPPLTDSNVDDSEALTSRLLAANALTKMTSMTGRAMEAFNKSLSHRRMDSDEGLRLRADADRWWNDIDMDSDDDSAFPDPRRRYPILFNCLYHQQTINLNRPALSLPPSATHHACALQASIASARTILSQLSKSTDQRDLFWPGYVDMVFFACLLLVYGSRREIQNASNVARLHADLKRALGILEVLQERWNNLAGFVRVVRAFIRRIDPSAQGEDAETSQSAMAAQLQEMLRNEFEFADPTTSDFFFDFSSFELNPDSTWAYHASVPGSPVFPNDA